MVSGGWYPPTWPLNSTAPNGVSQEKPDGQLSRQSGCPIGQETALWRVPPARKAAG